MEKELHVLSTTIIKEREFENKIARYMILCTASLSAVIILVFGFMNPNNKVGTNVLVGYSTPSGLTRSESAILTLIAPTPSPTPTITLTPYSHINLAPTPTSFADNECKDVKGGQICTMSFPPEATTDPFRNCDMVTPIPGAKVYCRKTDTNGTSAEQGVK